MKEYKNCVFKIRSKKTGLFSKGGMNVTDSSLYWSKNGKVWPTYAALNLHLKQYNTIPRDWEIIVIRVEYTEQNTIDANKFL